MSEIRFYHLQTQDLGQALPQVLTKAIAGGKRVVIRLPNDDIAEKMAAHLWTYNPDSFLPHGTKKDGFAEDQPIYITAGNDNPNKADLLITGMGVAPDDVDHFALVCEFLDGHDDAQITAARQRWKTYKDAGHAITYWQQTPTGGWEQKA